MPAGQAGDLLVRVIANADRVQIVSVEAGQDGDRDNFRFWGAAPFAASIIAWPPAAWTVRIAGFKAASASTALATVFGMS